MDTSPLLIEETNLSIAWQKTLKHLVDNPGKEISPLIVSLTEYDEVNDIRRILDDHLRSNNLPSIETVSETIFPNSLYKLFGKDRKVLYDEYIKNLPRLKKIEPKGNGRGTYFERLIAYEGKSGEKVNQLEIIINSFNNTSVHRRSKLQASIFDPRVDHTDGMFQGFPCLQHVTFFKTKNGGLVLNSFYAIQYLYRRGYGNWLGLINLGRFMAEELGLKFERFNCFIGVEHLDHIKKFEAEKLLKMIS